MLEPGGIIISFAKKSQCQKEVNSFLARLYFIQTQVCLLSIHQRTHSQWQLVGGSALAVIVVVAFFMPVYNLRWCNYVHTYKRIFKSIIF